MPGPVAEIRARIADIEANVHLIEVSTTLRPRLNGVLRWEAGGEAIALAKSFLEAKEHRREAIFSALLVQAMAAFERFLRQTLAHGLATISSRVGAYADLPVSLRNSHVTLTGRLLANHLGLKDHISLDIGALSGNLHSCYLEVSPPPLNTNAFTATVSSASPDAIDSALDYFEIEGFWDQLGQQAETQKILGTTGSRDTAKLAREYHSQLCRQRNMVCHGGDEEVALSSDEIRRALRYLSVCSTTLESLLAVRLR